MSVWETIKSWFSKPEAPKAPAKPSPEQDKPVMTAPPAKDKFGAPWVFSFAHLLGLDETNSKVVAAFVYVWKKVGLSYDNLSGTAHAWCAIAVIAALDKSGVVWKGLNAGARSGSTFGKKCPFWFGAILDIIHKSGGRHICFFLYWIDEKKKIAATLDGNKGNKYCVAITDLSGSGDKLVAGPRWPSGWPDGIFVSKDEVMKKYPNLKPTASSGSSTR